jgi:hypothetical protein
MRCTFLSLFFFTLTAPLLGQSNPVPYVNQPLVPDTVAPGGHDFTLIVNGTGFIPGAVVNWNGEPRRTKFINASKLTATITSSDIAESGTASVSVVNPGTEATSNIVFFPVVVSVTSVSFARQDYSSISYGGAGRCHW